MGVDKIDKWTLGHFIGGSMSGILIYPNDYIKSFILNNGFHFFIELLEKDISPDGEILQTFDNHLFDIIAFFLGWLLSIKLELYKYITNIYFYILLIIVFVLSTLSEVLREVYPYSNNILFKGTFVSDEKSKHFLIP